jgi:tRNA(Ile)-lysidine synthetase-like protein
VTVEALIFEPADPLPPFEPAEAVLLVVPGTTPLPWTGGAISARVLGVEDWGLGPDGAPFLRPPAPNTQHPTPNQALLDGARLAGTLTARPPRPGDRIQPLGMGGHRKLQDLLTDRKAPRSTRRRLPVICDAEKIVWVAGYCVSEAAKVTGATKEALLLVWENDERRSG